MDRDRALPILLRSRTDRMDFLSALSFLSFLSGFFRISCYSVLFCVVLCCSVLFCAVLSNSYRFFQIPSVSPVFFRIFPDSSVFFRFLPNNQPLLNWQNDSSAYLTESHGLFYLTGRNKPQWCFVRDIAKEKQRKSIKQQRGLFSERCFS